MIVAPAALLESEAAAKAAAAEAMDVEDGKRQQGDDEAAAATSTSTTTADSDRLAPGLNLVYIFPVHTMASTSIHRNFQTTTKHNLIKTETSEPNSRRE